MMIKYTLALTGLIWYTLVSLSACRQHLLRRPVPASELTTLTVPFEGLAFVATGRNWKATLLTFTQPIELNIEYTNTGFIVFQDSPAGIIEGPGKLCLNSGNNHFFYDAWLQNQEFTSPETIDIRSPKTVNPDSSLNQQRIVFTIDEWSNIVSVNEENHLFFEEEVFLLPLAGVYRAQEYNPLSAFNVQPGSCVSIPLNAQFNEGDQHILAKAGPLKDRFDNLVADGTVVTFIYDDGQYIYRTETALINGFALTEIPFDPGNNYQLYAQVHSTHSITIQLNLKS